MNNKTSLILPVYLNQRVVFDFIGMTEGGITNVETVTSTSNSLTATNREIGTSFGLANALSALVKIELSGKKEDNSSDNSGHVIQKEVFHTPASLFFRLRNTLYEYNHIKKLTNEYTPQPGDIIEFQCQLKNNSLLEMLNAFESLFDLAKIFAEVEKNNSHAPKKKNSGDNEMTLIKKQISKFKESLDTTSSVDLIADTIHESNYKSIMTLEQHFLNDPSMSDLVDGTFSVLGKVTHVIKDESESINLLRKTALSKMPIQTLEQMTGVFNSLNDQGLRLPNIELEIKGPVIQVLPIAIFS